MILCLWLLSALCRPQPDNAMYRDGEPLVDVFTPFNVFTGALAGARGANLGTMLLVALGFELAENAFIHFYGERMGIQRKEFTTNVAVGMLATAVGWTLARCALEGAFSRES